jgi:hypothetical protein
MEDLETLYRRAIYVVDDGDVKITIRLGHENTELSDYLATLKASTWAFLTAFNPNSLPATLEQNTARQAELIQLVEQHGYSYLHGYGTGKDWLREASIFIIDIPHTEAIKLAQKFHQSAILWGEIGIEPELVWCVVRQ